MALVRDILTKGLSEDPLIEVVGTAADPYAAALKIRELNPDVLTLDIEMPRMDGVEFLRRLMPQHPLPVIMVSALTERGKQITLDALHAGAIDFVAKPRADVARGLTAMMAELRDKIKMAATARVTRPLTHTRTHPPATPPGHTPLPESTDKVIAIGASTGGTEAIAEVLAGFPANMHGVVVVQHLPAGFTRVFAERLNNLCNLHVSEAAHGDRILRGRALIAPGGHHMSVIRCGGEYRVEIHKGQPVCGHCPSVDVLFRSLATHVGANALGIILTGMGHDGADALKAMRSAGARTLAQDQASSVVFGMPGEAFARGGAERLVPLAHIATETIRILPPT